MKNIDKSDCRTVKELIINEKISIDLLNEYELEKLIDYETENVINSKTEPDMSFLNACYEALGKYKDYKNIISEEDVNEIAGNAYQQYLSAQISNAKPKKRNRIFTKVAISFASVCLVLLSSFSVMALAMGGYSQAWNYISTHVHEILHMDEKKKTVDGIEIIKSDYTQKYETIEELLREENLDILYPSALPNGYQMEKIVLKNSDDKSEYIFLFNTSNINFYVTKYFSIDIGKLEYLEIYKVCDADFYITQLPDNVFQAIAHVNEMEYTIICSNYDELVLILSNMKGF